MFEGSAGLARLADRVRLALGTHSHTRGRRTQRLSQQSHKSQNVYNDHCILHGMDAFDCVPWHCVRETQTPRASPLQLAEGSAARSAGLPT